VYHVADLWYPDVTGVNLTGAELANLRSLRLRLGYQLVTIGQNYEPPRPSKSCHGSILSRVRTYAIPGAVHTEYPRAIGADRSACATSQTPIRYLPATYPSDSRRMSDDV